MDERLIDTLQHPAVLILQEFFAAMQRWEMERLTESRDIPKRFLCKSGAEIEAGLSEIRNAARAQLASIFEKFCEAGSKAKRVNDVIHYGGDEPDYNPEKEKIFSIIRQGGKVVIETQMTHQLRSRLKYEMVEIDGNWKVRDNRKFYGKHTQKWQRKDL